MRVRVRPSSAVHHGRHKPRTVEGEERSGERTEDREVGVLAVGEGPGLVTRQLQRLARHNVLHRVTVATNRPLCKHLVSDE